MHHIGDAVLGERGIEQRAVERGADDQGDALRDPGGHTRRQIVEHDDALACLTQGPYDMGADVAGTTRDQVRHSAHPRSG